MSSLVYPTLPGVTLKVEREVIYSTTIHTSPSGREQRASWQSAARYRYVLSYEVTRNDTAAPSPFAAFSETGVILSFLDLHKGSWDSFLFPDPMTGSNVRVRLEADSLVMEQVVPGIWSVKKLALLSVVA